MRFSSLLALPACLASAVYAADVDGYRENLGLKPLPGGSLYAGFEFHGTSLLSDYNAQHFRYFPRSLAQILQYTHTAELHLRFALGRWDEESWGSRPRSGVREGGNGVELWAWLEADEDGGVEGRWSDLVNSLSGLFCASLNFIDSGKTVRPVLSFDSEGSLDGFQKAQRNLTRKTQRDLEMLHGMLPHEVVCTENLTPFLKLLPCKGKAGISTLLDGHKLFDANWQTMSIDVMPECPTNGECQLHIRQTVDMVLDIQRSMRPQDNPIPRPLPIENILCDEGKPYNAPDTCYPAPLAAEMEWSLSQIFGRSIKGSCLARPPHDQSDWSDVRLEVAQERNVTVLPEGTSHKSVNHDKDQPFVTHYYRLSEDQPFDLSLPNQIIPSTLPLDEPPLYATRQITGYGAERGGMHATLTNPHPYSQRIVYLESLPWFLRPYIHTLHVDGGKIEKMYYTPLLDRQRGTHLELLIEVPATSTVELTYDFEKAILRYTEYPPDANRGFDVAPAIIRVLPPPTVHSSIGGAGERRNYYYLRTTSLLLPLPTPDFSMPYNVIILTSTVIALGFGSIFNLLVRRFVLLQEVPTSPLVAGVKRIIQKLKDAVTRLKGVKDTSSAAATKTRSSDAVTQASVKDS